MFPTTIRRRILRHLYLRHFRNAYLFKGVRQKFIDALLGVARIELFMPQASAPVLAGVYSVAMRGAGTACMRLSYTPFDNGVCKGIEQGAQCSSVVFAMLKGRHSITATREAPVDAVGLREVVKPTTP